VFCDVEVFFILTIVAMVCCGKWWFVVVECHTTEKSGIKLDKTSR